MDGEKPASEADGPPPAVEAIDVSKRYRPLEEVGLVPIPWLRRRKRLQRTDDPMFGGDDFDDDDDLDDDDDDFEEEDEEPTEAPPRIDAEIWALRDISFSLAPGQVLGVVGGNGAGKSTLIRVLARITSPTSGEAITRGRVAPAVSVTGAFIDGPKSGVQCIYQVARFLQIPREVAASAIEPIRALTELGDALDLQTRTYSSGELQRLAFATSICLDPDILITDEIRLVGDKEFRQRSFEALKERIDEGLTVVLATHDSRRVRELCTQVLLLEEGKVAALGTPDDVLPRFEAAASAGAAERMKAAKRERDPGDDEVVPEPEAASSDASIETVGAFDMKGRPLDLLRSDAECLLELTFSLHRAPKDLRCVITLAEEGDIRVRVAQPELYTAETGGLHAASVHLPGGSLPGGSYYAEASLLEYTGKERALLAKRAFRLEVVGEERSELPQGGVRIKRPWEMTPIDLPAPGGNGAGG